MYILMIARGIPSDKYPQWGCFEKDQAEALASIGHKVVVISLDRRFLFIWRKIGLTHQTINNVEYYNYFLYSQKVTDLLSHSLSLRINNKLIQHIYNLVVQKHGKPDIIYGQMFGNTQMGIYLSKKHKIPIVGIEHLARFNEPTLDHWGYTEQDAKYTYNNVDAAITVSTNLKQALINHFAINSYVVHNLVGKEFFYIPKLSNDFPIIITTGSLIHRKGFDLLITALSTIQTELPKNWQTIIIGSGELREVLQRQINNLSLQSHIHLVGHKNKKEIVPLLQQSDIFILPSRNENFSVAVLEALACGLPVIASICGGIRECINEKNGLLFPVDDVEKLAQSILYAVQHIDKYDRKAIAEDCQARFSPEVIAKQLTKIFEETIKKHKEKQ